MTILPIVTADKNFAALATAGIPYDFASQTNEERIQMIKDMVETMWKMNGVGLSANQVGLPWSLFVMRGMPNDVACFNPRMAQPGDEIVNLEEGCLSFPGMHIKMKRPKTIRVRYADILGNVDSYTYTGITARVFQHELCHVEGRMWFEGCSRIQLERAINQAKSKKFGCHDYSGMGLLKYAK